MFGLFLNSLSKVSADSSVLSYKSKIFAIYCDLEKIITFFFFKLNIFLRVWTDSLVYLERIS